MDLDKIKQSWNNIDPQPSTIDVRDIIHGKVRTSIEQLIRTETAFMFLILILLPIPYLCDKFLTTNNISFPISTKWIYIIFCIVSVVWQGYKRYFLTTIHVRRNGILEPAKSMLRYKLFLKLEIWFSLVFILSTFGSLLYEWDDVLSDKNFIILCLINVALWILVAICLFYAYKHGYSKKIKQIEATLHEIDITEREDQEEEEKFY